MYDKDDHGTDDFEGQVEIPLKDIDHQNKIEGQYNLMEKDGCVSEGEIRLKLHLVWSKKGFFKSNLDKCTEHLKNIEDESARLNEFLENIKEKPFGVFLSPEITEIIDEKVFIKEYDISDLNKKTQIVKPKQPKSFVTSLTHMVRGGLSK